MVREDQEVVSGRQKCDEFKEEGKCKWRGKAVRSQARTEQSD